jgi:hypothetical protein
MSQAWHQEIMVIADMMHYAREEARYRSMAHSMVFMPRPIAMGLTSAFLTLSPTVHNARKCPRSVILDERSAYGAETTNSKTYPSSSSIGRKCNREGLHSASKVSKVQAAGMGTLAFDIRLGRKGGRGGAMVGIGVEGVFARFRGDIEAAGNGEQSWFVISHGDMGITVTNGWV